MDRLSSVLVMRKVCDWQLAHPKHQDVEWYNGVLFTGMMALYYTTNDARYLDVMIARGERRCMAMGIWSILFLVNDSFSRPVAETMNNRCPWLDSSRENRRTSDSPPPTSRDVRRIARFIVDMPRETSNHKA